MTSAGPVLADERGASEVIGFVLVVALVILALALLQTFAVPAWNAEVEFAHNAEVQGDAIDLRGAIMATAGFGNERSTSVDLGVRYPGRYLLINPPPASGTIETTEPGTVSIENVRAFGHENTRAFWASSDRHDRQTRFIQYRPDYAEYGTAPTTVLEHGVLYNRFDEETNLVRANRDVIDDTRITLVAIDGELSESGVDPTAVDVSPVSAPTQRTVVSAADPDEPLTIAVPTRLSASTWERLLAEELYDSASNPTGNVLDIRVEPAAGGEPYDTLVLELDPTERYELRLANVGVGTGAERSDPAYVVTEGRSTAPPTEEVVVQVRDEYGNPVPGATVDLSLVEGQCAGLPRTERADDSGRVVISCDSVATLAAAIGDDASYESVQVRFGTPVEVDGTTPTLSATASSETREFDVQPGAESPATLSQVTVGYTATDEVSGVARVFVALYDGSGANAEQVTATTHAYETVGSHDGQWVTPWIEAAESELQGYEIRIRVVDHAGNTIRSEDCTLSTSGTATCS